MPEKKKQRGRGRVGSAEALPPAPGVSAFDPRALRGPADQDRPLRGRPPKRLARPRRGRDRAGNSDPWLGPHGPSLFLRRCRRRRLNEETQFAHLPPFLPNPEKIYSELERKGEYSVFKELLRRGHKETNNLSPCGHPRRWRDGLFFKEPVP